VSVEVITLAGTAVDGESVSGGQSGSFSGGLGASFFCMIISTRLFIARPDAVSLEALGFSLPMPFTLSRDGSTPFLTR
jgi:hypothetical protein